MVSPDSPELSMVSPDSPDSRTRAAETHQGHPGRSHVCRRKTGVGKYPGEAMNSGGILLFTAPN